MLKFLSQSECPKCKENRFFKGTNRFINKYHKSPVDEELNICEGVESLFEREHIDVTCSKCNYQWVEATADYDSEEHDNPSETILITKLEYEQLKEKAWKYDDLST